VGVLVGAVVARPVAALLTAIVSFVMAALFVMAAAVVPIWPRTTVSVLVLTAVTSMTSAPTRTWSYAAALRAEFEATTMEVAVVPETAGVTVLAGFASAAAGVDCVLTEAPLLATAAVVLRTPRRRRRLLALTPRTCMISEPTLM
jgi:hypothetical protein